MNLDKSAVVKSILEWPGRYETEAGRVFLGMPVSEVPKQLRSSGWKNVSRLDRSDFRSLGLEIVTARYVGGARAKRFCDVVVATWALDLKPWTPDEEAAEPFNIALHDHLISLGYRRERVEASWEDVGDAENGPKLEGGPAFDCYTGADEYVYASEIGVLDRNARDEAFEQWADEQSRPMSEVL